MLKITFLDKRTEKEFRDFPPDMAAHFSRTVLLMQEFGTHTIGLPHMCRVSGTDLWEIRVKGKAGIGRMLYGVNGQEIIILHAFIKKTQKTPRQAIELAQKRWKEM